MLLFGFTVKYHRDRSISSSENSLRIKYHTISRNDKSVADMRKRGKVENMRKGENSKCDLRKLGIEVFPSGSLSRQFQHHRQFLGVYIGFPEKYDACVICLPTFI